MPRSRALDYATPAIEAARTRTDDKAERLVFMQGNMNALALPEAGFDTVVSIDSLYFVDDLERTLATLLPALEPGGQMGILFTQWLEAGDSPDLLRADDTRLAVVLKGLGLSYRTWDFTENVKRHWHLNRAVAEELKAAFEAEGNGFLYDFRAMEFEEFMPIVETGEISRTLYHVRP